MLRVSLLGNLGADPELRYSQKGAPMTTFRVAVNQVRTNAEGEREEHTEWFAVRGMGRLAESAQRLTKGSRVFVAGRLDIRHFQSREGEPRVGFDVWADEIVNVSGRAPGAEPGAEAVSSSGAPTEIEEGTSALAAVAGKGREPAVTGGRAHPAAEELDDLPF